MWSSKVFLRFGLLGTFFSIAGGIGIFVSGNRMDLAEIGANAPIQVVGQDVVNGIVLTLLYLAILFVLGGCIGNVARALFSMAAHTIRSQEPQFLNTRQPEANMIFSFLELDAFGRMPSVKDQGN